MEPAVDAFHPILRVLERYRSDVHFLRPPAASGAIPTVQQHLGREIPPSFLAFLDRWNGATLFRGALRIRGAADLAPADAECPEVILFADGPRPEDRWGWAAVGAGHHFGRWVDGRLVPLHEHFSRWLLAQTRLLDEDVRDPTAELAIRLEVDPTCGLLLLAGGEAQLAAGDVDGAVRTFRRATAQDPELPRAWQRLGECLLGVERGQAVGALLLALRGTSLPHAYPGAPAGDAALIRSMEHLFPAGDSGWERELRHLLEERVAEVSDDAAAELVEAAALALTRARLATLDREGARDILLNLRGRTAAWRRPPDLAEVQLTLAGLQADLGEHDEAEETVRRLRRHPDAAVRGRAETLVGRVALARDEAFVEEILRGALALLKRPEHRCDALLLLAERPDPAALDEAARTADLLSDRVRQARVALLRGDAARAAGDLPAANMHWMATSADPEAECRARIRFGDACEDAADAMPHYVAAVEGFRSLNLPVREAWARLRLVRCGDASQAEQALRSFRAWGLAAGVSAAERLLERGGDSVAWHMGVAAEMARQRHDAQRLRPPLLRSDADRPERRLLGHRRALAQTDTAVVAAIAEDAGAELRRIQSSEGRARDPAAMRFIADIDLLAGHPSWQAAETLLGILGEPIPQEAAARSLIGAMARSPNMTLVEGLLRVAQQGEEPCAVAQAVEVLGWRREGEATTRLRELAVLASTPVRRAAITALGRLGDEAAVDLILPALEQPETAEVASVALLLLGEWAGVDYHGQALAHDEGAASSGEFVGRYGGPAWLLLLLSLADRDTANAAGAIGGLGLMGSVRAVPKLLDLVGGRDPKKAAQASTALELLTGHREDMEEAHPQRRWQEWWSANAEKLRDGVRWREGRPLGIRGLVDRLGHDDLAVRLATYDELVIATGQRLPFDADGPWRQQQAHQAAWARWHADHAHELPDHGWLFHGRGVG